MKSKKQPSKRIIVDTNIWISFLIGKTLAGLHHHIHSGRVQIIICPAQLLELTDVLARPRIRKYIPEEKALEFLDLLDQAAELVEPEMGPPLCRDPKDDYLLYAAMSSNAHYLVSGDKDLLTLRHIGATQIIAYTEFNSLMEE